MIYFILFIIFNVISGRRVLLQSLDCPTGDCTAITAAAQARLPGVLFVCDTRISTCTVQCSTNSDCDAVSAIPGVPPGMICDSSVIPKLCVLPPPPTTASPTTKAPTTKSPTTRAPTTKAPTTKAPTTKAPTTRAPTTKAPTTRAPTTKSPTTKAPTTRAPTTKAPTTKAPTTKAPTTRAPTTRAPTNATTNSTTNAPTNTTTVAPTTRAPTTRTPTTRAPTNAPTNATTNTTTNAPTTRAPTTRAPTTRAPTNATTNTTTNAPTTRAPTTRAPTTRAPTNATANPTTHPTTKAPTTKAPTTRAPTTSAPTTRAPTTKAPTTRAPTTRAPTTRAPTTRAPICGNVPLPSKPHGTYQCPSGSQCVYIDASSTCNGVNFGECGDINNPWPSFKKALTAMQWRQNDIIVKPGIYTGPQNRDIILQNTVKRIFSESGPGQTIIDCQNNGFGFYLNSGSLYMTGFTVRNCKAPIRDNSNGFEIEIWFYWQNTNYIPGGIGKFGGAFLMRNFYAELTDMIIRDNNAEFGGAVFQRSGELKLFNSIIYNNNAEKHGGAIFAMNGNNRLYNTIVSCNKAGDYGGGLLSYQSATSLKLESIISFNEADDGANEVLCDSSSSLVDTQNNAAIFDNNVASWPDNQIVFCDDCALKSIDQTINYCDASDSSVAYNVINNNYIYIVVGIVSLLLLVNIMFLCYKCGSFGKYKPYQKVAYISTEIDSSADDMQNLKEYQM